MRVFVAGAAGAIGRQLVPLLVHSGHQVTGLTRSRDKAEQIEAAGAVAVVADALDRTAVMGAVQKGLPEAIIHELTAIPGKFDLRHFDRDFALTNRLRTTGLDHLVEAARAVGCRRFLAQSYAGWPYAREGGPIKTEEDLLDTDPPREFRSTLEAIRYLERTVSGLPGMVGIALRYGGFYGPGTSLAAGSDMVSQVRRRRVPIVGSGAGVWSFVHITDAALATWKALERGSRGMYNIVDDEPAPVSEWLPALAAAIGAKPPRHIPEWLGRLVIGKHGVLMMTQVRGASNAKAKRELEWQPVWPTWREGFLKGLGVSLPPPVKR